MSQSSLLAYFATAPSTPPGLSTIDITSRQQPQDEKAKLVGRLEASLTSAANSDADQEATEAHLSKGQKLDFFNVSSHPQATIVKIISAYLPRLKNITSTLLPVRYPDTFFNECLEEETIGDFSRVLLWNSQPVGLIRCRLEDHENGNRQIYIQALGVLAPYRNYGLATQLLNLVTQPALIQKYGPISIYCHVWISNDDALGWYEKRGFKRVVMVEQYYRRLKPASAWVMRKELP